jgi:hypothetical protein
MYYKGIAIIKIINILFVIPKGEQVLSVFRGISLPATSGG